MRGQEFGDPFSETTTHATAAVASRTASTGKKHYITDVTASSDKAGALMLVKDGTTVIWRCQVATTAAGYNAYHHTFGTPLSGSQSAAISVEIDGTAVCHVNVAGYTL